MLALGGGVYASQAFQLQAQTAILEGNFEKATDWLRFSPAPDRQSRQIANYAIKKTWLIEIHLLRGQVEEARLVLEALEPLAGEISKVRVLHKAANLFAATGQIERATALATRIQDLADEFPSNILNAMSQHIQGAIAWYSDQPEQARSHLVQAYELWPDAHLAWSYAEILFRTGSVEDALLMYERVIEQKGRIIRNDDHFVGHWILSLKRAGECYLALDEREKARDYLQQFLDYWGGNAADHPEVIAAKNLLARDRAR
jgi:tetratricopeptide (TPR) repeat protein